MRRWLWVLMLVLALPLFAAAPHVDRWANGFRVIVLPTTSSQVVSVELLIDYSAFDEPEKYQGIRQVLLTSMLQGSRSVDGTTIRRRLTAIGGNLEGRVHQDMLEFTVSVPSSKLGVALSALAEIVCHPLLSDEYIQAAIAQSQRKVNIPPVGALDTAAYLSYQLLYEGHPFASRGFGTPESLANITPEVVRDAYHAYILPNIAVMSIVGRCTQDDAGAQAQAAFGLWADHPRAKRQVAVNPTLAHSTLDLREENVKSTCVMLTFPVCGVTHKDYLAVRLVDILLGGGTGSRLFRSVREDLHLAYETATDFPSQTTCSHFSLFALTDSGYMDDTKSALTSALAQLQVTPVTEQELQRAKAYLKGRYLLSHQYSAQYAFDLAWYELIGLGAGYETSLPANIDAVTAKDIQRVARTYFTHYYLVVIIPQTTGSVESSTSSLGRLTARVQAE